MIQRNTIQCSVVLETVQKMQCHPSADEVYDEVVQHHPSISKGTVYRNLNRLVDMGKLGKIEVPDGADRFDHICTKHYHVRCEKCGKVFDVDMEYVPDFESGIKDTHGFDFTGCDIMFRGICPLCKAKEQ